MLQRIRDVYRSAPFKYLPMEGDMFRQNSNLDTGRVFGKLFGFGIGLYAIALLAQVLESYSLV